MARFQGTNRNDIINGTAQADRVEGKLGNDRISGFDGNDLLKGDGGDDTIFGGNGNDNLQGDAGNDRLFGGAGADQIEGGAGNDILTGGTGADTFVYGDPLTGTDRITDFTDRVDRIEFDLLTVNSFNDLTITQTAQGALVAWDGGAVLLLGIASTSLSGADFLF